jgi:uncharacterized cupin superfamily protein
VNHVAHWDDIEPFRREAGHIAGAWTDLASAANSVMVGVRRIQVDPGRWSTPAHVEGAEEELFYVLGGSGLSWQDGAVYEVGEGDLIVHLALEEAHTLGAGPDGIDVLAFGMRSYAPGVGFLPRTRALWLGPTWGTAGSDRDHPFRREAAAGPPEVGEPAQRPATIVNVRDVEEVPFGEGDAVQALWRNLGRAAGSQQTGLKVVTVGPGKLGAPFHCHSAEEELFVVLDGDGVCTIGDEDHPVRRGSIVARPPGTRIAHAFRAGDGGLVYLAYGTREPNDIAYYPRSNKVYLRGVGLMARVERLDYWDGER